MLYTCIYEKIKTLIPREKLLIQDDVENGKILVILISFCFVFGLFGIVFLETRSEKLSKSSFKSTSEFMVLFTTKLNLWVVK